MKAPSGKFKSKLEGHDAIILGAGISGLTTAALLQALGFKPIFISADTPRQTWREMREEHLLPRLSSATNYAMASAYPHHLQIGNLERVSALSQDVLANFSQWHESGNLSSGVTSYRMYEVFEHEPEEPALGTRRRDLRKFWGEAQYLKDKFNVPTRPGANYLWGWQFDTYFVDMPQHMRFLWSHLNQVGVIECRITPEILPLILEAGGSRPIFNCLGYGAVSLFGDTEDAVIMRGQQVFVPEAVVPDGAAKCSYNYTPSPELFRRADGNAEYLHFFPRKDGILLGQTREPGTIDDTGRWQGREVQANYAKYGNEFVAAPIVELNAAILRDWLGLKLSDKLVGRRGYRYYRDPNKSGVKIGAESVGKALIIHNYGHGGSGITMAWGCALAAVEQLGKAKEISRPGAFTGSFSYMLRKWALQSSV